MELKLSAVGSLMTEHRLIERMIADISARADRAESEGRLDPHYVMTAVDFLRSYADRCHHGKEEDILFAELEVKGMAPEHREMMDALIADHVWARRTTRGLVERTERYREGEASALEGMVEAMRALVGFYPAHIEREDHGFFKPAIEYFTRAERESMAERFREFDRQLIHERYRLVLEELEAQRERPSVTAR